MKLPQVQYLDKVLQFINKVADISVVVQVFPKTTEVLQLQYIDKEVDVAVLHFVQVRSPREAREASTGAVLGHGGWNSSL